MKSIGLLALPLLLAACASMGDARVLSAPDLQRVRAGMTRDDALRLLGTPYQTMKFPLSGYESLDYRYQDPWGYLALFSVSIGAQGMVIGTMTQRLNDGGDHSNSK
ncbi:MAG: hypothetical protein ABIQ84_00545 [Usitatibacter sp.]